MAPLNQQTNDHLQEFDVTEQYKNLLNRWDEEKLNRKSKGEENRGFTFEKFLKDQNGLSVEQKIQIINIHRENITKKETSKNKIKPKSSSNTTNKRQEIYSNEMAIGLLEEDKIPQLILYLIQTQFLEFCNGLCLIDTNRINCLHNYFWRNFIYGYREFLKYFEDLGEYHPKQSISGYGSDWIFINPDGKTLKVEQKTMKINSNLPWCQLSNNTNVGMIDKLRTREDREKKWPKIKDQDYWAFKLLQEDKAILIIIKSTPGFISCLKEKLLKKNENDSYDNINITKGDILQFNPYITEIHYD